MRATVRAARRTVKAVAPKAREVAYRSEPPRSRSAMWKIAHYTSDGEHVAGIGVFPTYAVLYFLRGREIAHESRLLEGSGAKMRSIKLRTPADAKRPAVKRLVRMAFALGPPARRQSIRVTR